jgi:diguanylate cyclase (GGDEF)-like protein
MQRRVEDVVPAPVIPRAVLLIDPETTSRKRGADALRALGFQPRVASDVFEAHSLIDATYAVVAAHPAAAAIYPRLRSAGIAFVGSFTARAGKPTQLAQQIGADAYVTRPYKRDQLGPALYAAAGARLLRERLRRAELALADLAGVRHEDEHTGLLHIDLFKTLLPLEIRRARRHGYPIAICVVALDPLPNGRHLHRQVGLACEPLLRDAVRDVDLAVRYGEGRFLVFLPHTNGRGAEAVGRRIVAQLRGCHFQGDGGALQVTASVGIATARPGKAPSFARLVRDAHAAMKAAQLKGGDRAILR